MDGKGKSRRILSCFLAGVLLLTGSAGLVMAEEPESVPVYGEGLCQHHPEHTAECGYQEASPGNLCGHVHTEDCYTADDSGEEILNCQHVHDENCGYAEATEGSPCQYVCQICSESQEAEEPEEPEEVITDSSLEPVPTEEASVTEEPEETNTLTAAEITSWSWVDPDGNLQETEGTWVLGAAGASQENPLTREALESLLPRQIQAVTAQGETVTLDLVWDLSAVPEEGLAEGTHTFTAGLPEGYVLGEGVKGLEAEVEIGGAETYAVSPDELTNFTVPGLSPEGTTINVFDYWVKSNADDEKYNGIFDEGINNGHQLKFGKGMGQSFVDSNSPNPPNATTVNHWTQTSDVRQGIVYNVLEDGYPRLSVTAGQGNTAGLNGESLKYLFDPETDQAARAVYENAKGLLQVNGDGYYYYNSQANFAELNTITNQFTLYKEKAVYAAGSSPDGQFFPFNSGTQVFSKNAAGEIEMAKINAVGGAVEGGTEPATMNHYFGLTMTTRFIQDNQGHTKPQTQGGKPVTYEFSGDDDVWVFIDDVLVADLGGIHDMATLKIDFSTGAIIINEQETNIKKTSTLKQQFEKAGKYNSTSWRGNTFADKTYHTLKFFYLERGNTDSNMSLKFNLVTIPESSVIKVDQTGEPVDGAKFELQTMNGTTIASGETNSQGEFVFYDDNDYPLSIDEIYQQCSADTGDTTKLKLVETKVPAGYRSNGDMILYFHTSPDGEHVLLLSENHWDTGAYAMPRVTTTLPTSVKLYNNQGTFVKEEDPAKAGVLFAVIMKKGEQENTWYPVYGDPLNGWTVAETLSWDTIRTAVLENIRLEHDYRFRLTPSGSYQVTIDNLPGDIKTYYYMTGGKLENTKYTVAYYYSTASDLNQVDGTNTYLMNPQNIPDQMSRVYSADLYVPNIKNRLLIQKVDEELNPVNGVEFALYKSEDLEPVADTTEISPEKQIYVDSEDSTKKLAISEDAIPYDKRTTKHIEETIDLEGGGVFPTSEKGILKCGTYYLVEINTPEGYVSDHTAVKVVVDNTGVYAHAGTEEDNISVLKGVGSVVRSMVQFAVDDKVDTTLNTIKAGLGTVTYENGSFSGDDASVVWDGEEILHLTYANKYNVLDYGVTGATKEGNLEDLTLTAEEGWSKLFIRQCYNHDGNTDTSLKTNLKDQDITKLFSGTTIVRVKNQSVGNLQISKQVEGDTPNNEQVFTFEIKLYPGKGTEPAQTYTYNYKTSDGQTGTVQVNSEGKVTPNITLKNNETLTILNLPVETQFEINEVSVPGYTPSVTVNGKAQESSTAEGTISHVPTEDGTVDITTEVAYTNTFSKDVSVSLQGKKTLDGRTLREGEFTFALDRTDSGAKEAVVMPEKREVSVNENGDFAFENIIFKQDGTYTFSITEKQPEGADPYAKGTEYDTHTATVTVEVKADANELLTATVSYDNAGAPSEEDQKVTDQAAFTNYVVDNFEFTKTDKGGMGENGKKLQGAVFAMYRLECTDTIHTEADHANSLIKVSDAQDGTIDSSYEYRDCWKLVTISTSGTDGLVSFENLRVTDEYRLVEIQAPAGYTLPNGQWRITYTNGQFGPIEGQGQVGKPVAIGVAGVEYYIMNYQPTELPVSGNRGIRIFAAAGGTLMLAGGLGLLWYKKRKPRRTA